MANLFVRKSIAVLKAESEIDDEHSLKRTLTATNLVMLGIGAIIGAGITGLACAFRLRQTHHRPAACRQCGRV